MMFSLHNSLRPFFDPGCNLGVILHFLVQSLQFWKLANVTASDAEGKFRNIVEGQVSKGNLEQMAQINES